MTDTDGSLLAHLAGRLTNRTETLATEALGHILSRSPKARSAVADLVETDGSQVRPLAKVRTEVSYPVRNGAIRPDLVGYDASERESVIFEVKFWARLMENQVSAYAELLPADKPSTLVIVGPELRRESLWAEIRRQLKMDGGTAGEDRNGLMAAPIPKAPTHRVALTSWRVLLRAIARNAEDARNDVRQLQALCDRQATPRLAPPDPRCDPTRPRRGIPEHVKTAGDAEAPRLRSLRSDRAEGARSSGRLARHPHRPLG